MTTAPGMDWQAPFGELTTGDAFVSRGRTITETDVVQFAALTGDTHPLHTDAVFAAAGPFGERVAHGMLTLSYAVGLVPLDARRVLALRRIADVVFKRPVRLGDTVHVEGTITKLSAVSEGAGLVTFSWRVCDAGGRLLTRASVDVLWATGVAATAAAADDDDEDALHPAGSFVPVPF